MRRICDYLETFTTHQTPHTFILYNEAAYGTVRLTLNDIRGAYAC